MSETILIPRKIVNQLLQLAQQSPEAEICGLLGGQAGVPTRCYPVKNIATTPGQQFLLDAAGHIAATQAMRQRDETLFAIYHSHPHAPALPSASDLQLGEYPDTLYLIISLATKGVLAMRGFYLNGADTREVPLLLCER